MNDIEQSAPIDRYPTLKYQEVSRNWINGHWILNFTKIVPYQIPLMFKRYNDDGETVSYEYQIYAKMPCRSMHDYDRLREVCNANAVALEIDDTLRFRPKF